MIRSVFKITILIFLLFFSGCSDIGDVGNTSSPKAKSEPKLEKENNISSEPQTKIDEEPEKVDSPKEKPNIEIEDTKKDEFVFQSNNPYKNFFQPTTEKDPDAPIYIEPKKEYINGKELKTLSGDIQQNLILTKNIYWKISGNVKIKDGYLLSIESGTTIFGENQNSILTFEKGSQLIAIGKKREPIIFTSQNDILNLEPKGGDWVGLQLSETYSSILKYVQIRYSGHNKASLQLENIKFDTVLEFLEIYYSNNDGIQLNGGDVNLRNILILGADGDSLSLKNSWKGKVQNIYIHQFNDSFGDKSSGLEVSSDIKNIILTNLIIVSDKKDVGAGIYLKKNSSVQIINSIITGKRTAVCLKSEELSTDHIFRSNVLSCQNGNLERLKLDRLENSLLSETSSLKILSTKVEPINSYSLDNWFDDYPQLYIGAFNFNSTKKWSDIWSIGMEDIFNEK